MPKSRSKFWWYLSAVIVVAALALLPIGLMHGNWLHPSSPDQQQAHAEHQPPKIESPPTPDGIRVETMLPISGGLSRRTSQPGSAHSWESAELFSKVSGFLLAQH